MSEEIQNDQQAMMDEIGESMFGKDFKWIRNVSIPDNGLIFEPRQVFEKLYSEGFRRPERNVRMQTTQIVAFDGKVVSGREYSNMAGPNHNPDGSKQTTVAVYVRNSIGRFSLFG